MERQIINAEQVEPVPTRQDGEAWQRAPRAAQAKDWQCQQIEWQIEAADGALRQPHSGQWGDQLNEQRRHFMDQRFVLLSLGRRVMGDGAQMATQGLHSRIRFI